MDHENLTERICGEEAQQEKLSVWFGAKVWVGPPQMTDAGSSPRRIRPGTELSFGKLDLNIFPSMAIKTVWASAAHVTATQRHSKQPQGEGTVNRTLSP